MTGGFWLPPAVRRLSHRLYPLQASRADVEQVTAQAMLETMALHQLGSIEGAVAPVDPGVLLPALKPTLRIDPELDDHLRLTVLSTYRRLVASRAPERAALFHLADVNAAFGDGYKTRCLLASDLRAHQRVSLVREARRNSGGMRRPWCKSLPCLRPAVRPAGEATRWPWR